MLPECASGRRGGGEEVTPCTAAGSREDRGRKRRPEMVKWGGPKKTAISLYKLKFSVIVIPWLQGFIVESHPEPEGAARGRGCGFQMINP